MRKNKRLAAMLLAAVMTLLLCACGGDSGTKSPEPVNEITFGIAQDLDDTLDPHRMIAAGTREVFFNIYEGLVKPASDGSLIGAIAESWTISDTADEFTFTLREGVKFHNGETVTAEDVVFSVTRAFEYDRDTPLSKLESAEKLDERTVVVKTTEPGIETLASLTCAIIPAGSEPSEANIGTGPFKLASRSALENVVIERFDDYWGTPAYLDRVTFQITTNAETLVMSLKSGAIDMAAHLTASQVAELPDMKIVEGSMNLVQALYLNNTIEPLNDLRVRQALHYALDRAEIMEFLSEGRGTAVGSSMYPAFGKYFVPELVDMYQTDIEKAKQLLADAGYADGFELEITVPSNYTPHVDTAQVLVEQLKKIGVTAHINQIEWTSWLSDVYGGRNFESTVIGFDASVLTAGAMLDRWHSEHGRNMIGFENAEYDEAIDKAHASIDDEEQTALYKRAQEILAEQAANVYIQDLCDMVVMRPDLEGYEFYPLYALDLATVRFVS